MKTTLARILEASQILCWARAKGSNRGSLQHAWHRLHDGQLAALCGIHPGSTPVSQSYRMVRVGRACKHCLRFFPASNPKRPRTASVAGVAGLTIPPRAGVGELFQLIGATIKADRMQNDFGLDATLAALAQAIQDRDTDALALAIGNQAIAAIVNARASGVEAECAFIELAHRHAWFGTLDDAFHQASTYTVEHRGKPLRLLIAFARSSRALRPNLNHHARIDHVGLQVYYLVALASLHGLDATECIRTAIRHFDANPPASTPAPSTASPQFGLLPMWQAAVKSGTEPAVKSPTPAASDAAQPQYGLLSAWPAANPGTAATSPA